MNSQSKKIAIIGGGIALIAIIIGIVCYSIYDSTKKDLISEIKAIPAFNESEVCKNEAQAIGYLWPVLPPTRTTAELSGIAATQAEGIVGRIYSPALLAQRRKVATAQLALAKTGKTVKFETNNNQAISGKVKSVRGNTLTIGTTKYTLGTAPNNIKETYKYLFNSSELNRAKMRSAGDVARKFDEEKSATKAKHMARIEAQLMRENNYTIINNSWIAVSAHIKQQVSRAHSIYQHEKAQKINDLCEKYKCFGHKFTVEELGFGTAE